MKYPRIIRMTPAWLRDLNDIQVEIKGGFGTEAFYAPARPLPFYGRGYRLKAAWMVLTGRADALMWPETIAEEERLASRSLGERSNFEIAWYLFIIGDWVGALKFLYGWLFSPGIL